MNHHYCKPWQKPVHFAKILNSEANEYMNFDFGCALNIMYLPKSTPLPSGSNGGRQLEV
jgi:hypothetical protein